MSSLWSSGFSPPSSWVPRGNIQRRSIRRERGGNCMTSSDSTLGVTQCHFCHIALVADGSLRPLRSKGTGIWWESSKATWQKNTMDKKCHCRRPWTRPAAMASRDTPARPGADLINSQYLLRISVKHCAQQFVGKITCHPPSSSIFMLL